MNQLRIIDQGFGPTRVFGLVAECTLLITMMFGLGAVCVRLGLVSLMILIGPGNLETPKLFALGIPLSAIAACFASMVGLLMCSLGLVRRIRLVKWPIIGFFVLGSLSSPLAVSAGADDFTLLGLLGYLSGWYVGLLLAALGAFHLAESRLGQKWGLSTESDTKIHRGKSIQG